MRLLLLGVLACTCLSHPIMADEIKYEDDECAQELFVAFFPKPFVAQTLAKFNVPEQNRAAIINELADQELDVIPLVEKIAATMSPNPLSQPDQQDVVIQLFEEVVFNIFTNVLTSNGIQDQQIIAEMLEDIHQQKAERFRKCMNQSFGD